MKIFFFSIFQLVLLLGLILNPMYSQNTGNIKSQYIGQQEFSSFVIDTLLIDKISIRAIAPDTDRVYYAGDKGRYGFIDLQTNKKTEFYIQNGNLLPEFRSIAQTSKYIFLLNAGTPALLYRIAKDGSEAKLVYTETHEKVFYDSMQFRNETEGIAVGDPIADCFSIIVTRDGGNSWQKLPCSILPKTVDGEAAFAASNTNIVIKGDKTWIVSGGKKARVFYSFNNWETWNVTESPLAHGEKMTGIFTADFYDDKHGFIAGGNYDVPSQNYGNKAYTTDGGKSWKTIAENQGFGYASCVQYMPNGHGKRLVSVGGFGLQYSRDSGETWLQLSGDNDLYTIRFVNDDTAIAAGKNKIIRIQFLP